jgi:hypothetical protein
MIARRLASGLTLLLVLPALATAQQADAPDPRNGGIEAPGAVPSEALSPTGLEGARVRITTDSVVELPGIALLGGNDTTGNIVEKDRHSVTIEIADSTRVTLPRPRRTIIGLLAELDTNTMIVSQDEGARLTIPRGAVAKLEISNGRHSRTRKALFGLAIGAASGLTVGHVIGSRCQGKPGVPLSGLRCIGEPHASMAAGLLFAGGGGALIGALLNPGERWSEVVPASGMPRN